MLRSCQAPARRAAATTALLALLSSLITVTTLVAPTPAQAGDAPPAPVADFNAPLCPGTTSSDPTDVPAADHAGFSDLTVVTGARLASYNQGNVVPLYDTTGWGERTYPPMCGTYYDPVSNGPKSVWMYCTDLGAHTCGDIGPGATLNDGSRDVGQMVDQAGNPRLDAEDEAVIAWLLTHGHDVDHTGFATRADQSSFETRDALQYLIWCVSDPGGVEGTYPGFCATNLPAAEQAEIASRLPVLGAPTLALSAAQHSVEVGQTRRIRLTTSAFGQPITVQASGTAAGTLTVCPGTSAATLSGSTVTVTGSDPATPVAVDLCFAATSPGTYGLSAAVTAVRPDHLQWAQSDPLCQVYARFRHDAGAALSAAVSLAVAPRTPPGATAPGTPTLVTKASTSVAAPGARLFDTVTLSGFVEGRGARGTATLYGPLASVTSSSCTRATRFAVVSFTPRNGTVRTPSVRVTRAGYYTWVASTTADTANRATRHRCGLAAETTLVKRPRYRLTRVDTGFAGSVAPAQRGGGGSRLTMPALGIDATVAEAGIRGGRMKVPGSTAIVGRVRPSAQIGDEIGTTVLAGHVSDRRDRAGALWNLSRARPGQVLTYRAGGVTQRFKVTSVRRVSRAAKLPAGLTATTGKRRLVVISCTGKVVRNGRFHYTQNVIVTAVRVR